MIRCQIEAPDAAICDILARRCGFVEKQREQIVVGRQPGIAEEERGEMTALAAPGLLCFLYPESGLGTSIIEETFGFRPTKCLSFRIDKFDAHEDGIRNMLQACTALIKAFAVDCVLLENRDLPLLLRRWGKITLQACDPSWTNKLEMIAREIAEPYSFEAMPVL